MNIKRKTSLKGYLILARPIFKLIPEKGLSASQLFYYLYFVSQADWDRRHEQLYSCIIRDDNELAEGLKVNPSTVWRNKKALIECKLLKVKEGRTYINNLSLFEIGTVKSAIKADIANLQDYFAKPEDDLAKILMEIAETQETGVQNDGQSFKFPYKGRLDVFNEEDSDFDT
jgi:hypothetical protein